MDHLIRATGNWRGKDNTSTPLPVVRPESYPDQTPTTELAHQPFNVGTLCSHESPRDELGLVAERETVRQPTNVDTFVFTEAPG